MTKLGTVVHNENTVPLKSTEENLNFSSCSMNVGELFIRFICCDRAVPALLRTVSALHEIVELAVSCLLRTAFSVSDVVLLPIPSVCALFCSLNRQRWGFKNLALISRNPGIPLYISGIVFSQTLWFHANLKCLIPGDHNITAHHTTYTSYTYFYHLIPFTGSSIENWPFSLLMFFHWAIQNDDVPVRGHCPADFFPQTSMLLASSGFVARLFGELFGWDGLHHGIWPAEGREAGHVWHQK